MEVSFGETGEAESYHLVRNNPGTRNLEKFNWVFRFYPCLMRRSCDYYPKVSFYWRNFWNCSSCFVFVQRLLLLAAMKQALFCSRWSLAWSLVFAVWDGTRVSQNNTPSCAILEFFPEIHACYLKRLGIFCCSQTFIAECIVFPSMLR